MNLERNTNIHRPFEPASRERDISVDVNNSLNIVKLVKTGYNIMNNRNIIYILKQHFKYIKKLYLKF